MILALVICLMLSAAVILLAALKAAALADQAIAELDTRNTEL